MIRAAAIATPHAPVEIVELSTPALEPGGAMLRTLYSEVCGTDVHLHHGKLAGVPYPHRARATCPSAISRRYAARWWTSRARSFARVTS